jgi:hypothetical protein
MSIVAKFARYTDNAFFFSGGSLSESRFPRGGQRREGADDEPGQSSSSSTHQCTLRLRSPQSASSLGESPALPPCPPTNLPPRDPLDPSAHPIYAATDLFTKMQALFARSNTGPLGDKARSAAFEAVSASPMTYSERMAHISVLSAGNTLAVILLVGVLIMQVGEWYVEENVVKPVELEIERKRLADLAAAAVAEVTEEKKTQ